MVKDTRSNLGTGRTRWRRFAAVTLPAVAAAGAIIFGMADGAIAASFSVSGSTFKVSASKLDGTGFVQYGGLAVESGGNPKNLADPKVHPVAVSGIADAKLYDLCQSVVVPGTPVTMVIRAGGGGNPATATNLLIDMESLSGDATFTNISIGQDASTLDKGPAGAVGQPGGFGQQASGVVITNLHQVAWSTSAGTFALNGLNLSINLTKSECF